jgi:putative alpha-1,2-mannosidase
MGAPLFKKATIHLENGKDFVIEAPENSEKNIYIDRLKLNGKTYTRNYITHSDIFNGGKMEAAMTDKPNTKRGTGEKDRPYSFSRDEK